MGVKVLSILAMVGVLAASGSRLGLVAYSTRTFVPIAGDVELEERLYRTYLRSYEALLSLYCV